MLSAGMSGNGKKYIRRQLVRGLEPKNPQKPSASHSLATYVFWWREKVEHWDGLSRTGERGGGWTDDSSRALIHPSIQSALSTLSPKTRQ